MTGTIDRGRTLAIWVPITPWVRLDIAKICASDAIIFARAGRFPVGISRTAKLAETLQDFWPSVRHDASGRLTRCNVA